MVFAVHLNQSTLDLEHNTLRGQIEQLKTSLEEAQITRKRKMEYDLIAEKVNTLPSREELEKYVISFRDLFSDWKKLLGL